MVNHIAVENSNDITLCINGALDTTKSLTNTT